MSHFEQLCTCVGRDNLITDEPMRLHTTFRIGGPADYYLCPRTQEQLAAAVACCRREDIPYFIIGNGSNLLVSDDGYRGAVIQIYKNMDRFTVSGQTITAEAGALLSALAAAARDAGLTGMEFASGIPGTLGGAVTMNAGAYGGEMKDILRSVTILDKSGVIRTIPAEDLALGYRTSVVKTEDWIILSAEMTLQAGEISSITEKMEELKEARTSKQPLNYPSAGSTFKRPPGHFAGKLIMDAGLAGASVGDAQVSEKHCGFVINTGTASAMDVWNLICLVQKKVQEEYGVQLEPEVKFLGQFPKEARCAVSL